MAEIVPDEDIVGLLVDVPDLDERIEALQLTLGGQRSRQTSNFAVHFSRSYELSLDTAPGWISEVFAPGETNNTPGRYFVKPWNVTM
jgi:hypothetical protein